MKVLKLETRIAKWEQTNNDFTGHIIDGEKQSFILLPHDPIQKTMFMVGGNVYITDPNTDFILDIDLQTVIQMDIDGERPTVKELYEAYLEAREDWRIEILKETMKKGIIINRQSPKPPIEKLDEYLNKVLFNTYPID